MMLNPKLLLLFFYSVAAYSQIKYQGKKIPFLTAPNSENVIKYLDVNSSISRIDESLKEYFPDEENLETVKKNIKSLKSQIYEYNSCKSYGLYSSPILKSHLFKKGIVLKGGKTICFWKFINGKYEKITYSVLSTKIEGVEFVIDATYSQLVKGNKDLVMILPVKQWVKELMLLTNGVNAIVYEGQKEGTSLKKFNPIPSLKPKKVSTTAYEMYSGPNGILELNKRILLELDSHFSSVKLKKIKSSEEVENRSFLLKGHYENLLPLVKKRNIIITFRNAGKHTISRLKLNNPCKGHDVLEKSIKEKGDAYTYVMDRSDFEILKGCVGGKENDDKGVPPTLTHLWISENGKTIKKEKEKVTDLSTVYTGDYDMHDLIEDNKRVLAGTPNEASLLNILAFSMLKNDDRLKKTEEKKGRRQESHYSPIRHGAQTSYLSYLLSNTHEIAKGVKEGLLPYENAVINIDSNILAVTPNGTYHLKNVEEIYSFYKEEGLLNQIPIYYFFKYMRENEIALPELNFYTEYINYFISNNN